MSKVLRSYPPTEMAFWCPACKCEHPYRVVPVEGDQSQYPVWEWNGSMEKPTFSPSLLIFNRGRDSGTSCHLFVREGRIEYCSDCPHEFAGKTVDMVPLDPETDDWVYP